jgi:hypothetical protein
MKTNVDRQQTVGQKHAKGAANKIHQIVCGHTAIVADGRPAL